MPNNARTTTELYITTHNETGALARCTLALRESGINVDALCAYEKDPGTAAFHFVTSDNAKAKTLLTKNGYNVTETPVVCWSADNSPGTLNRGTSALAEHRVNITYTYCTTPPGTKTSWVIFNTNNNDETVKTLNSL